MSLRLQFSATLFVLIFSAEAVADDWPQFRGPGGQGHASAKNLPEKWSDTENITWKKSLPGLGWSSPVIQSDQIWLTTALDNGRSLRIVCLNRQSGETIHDIELFQIADPGRIHQKNSYASPTPVLEGDRVYAHFGRYGTACLSTDGKILWKKQIEYQHMHGPGGSPVLFEDLLVMNCDGTNEQFVVALDKRSGEIRWKRNRDGQHSYATPLIIEVGGKPQLISTGGDRVIAYDPRDGREIWWVTYDGYSLVPRPVFGHGLVFICSGYNNPVLYAIRPDGEGDVTASHVAWKMEQGAPHNPSPILVGDELFVVSDAGIATCLDARTGKRHWRQRLGGNFSASPLFADGRIYFLNEAGEATVITPGTQFEKLATNSVSGRTLASMAVAGSAIFLRTDQHLLRIEKAEQARLK